MRAFAAIGAWLCALAVGMAAYASHATAGIAQERLQTAAIFAFAHGLALVVLAPRASTRGMRIGVAMLLAGVLAFSGSLVAESLFGSRPRLAPAGGMLMIAAWLLLGAMSWKRRD